MQNFYNKSYKITAEIQEHVNEEKSHLQTALCTLKLSLRPTLIYRLNTASSRPQQACDQLILYFFLVPYFYRTPVTCMLNCLILSHRFTIFHSLFSQCFFLVVSVPMPSSSWCFHRGFGSAVNSTQGIFSFQIMYFFFRTSPRSFLDLSFLPSSCS